MPNETEIVEDASIRPGEIAVELPADFDAGLYFIGRIRTPWHLRKDCPRQGDPVTGPECFLEFDARYHAALTGIRAQSTIADPLLDGFRAPRPRHSNAAFARQRARHVRLALAGTAKSDRLVDRHARPRRKQWSRRQGARLPRWDAACRCETRFLSRGLSERPGWSGVMQQIVRR